MHFWCNISKIVRVYGKLEGIEVDPDKIKAIVEMKPPRTEKEIQGFLGRIQYISRFLHSVCFTGKPSVKIVFHIFQCLIEQKNLVHGKISLVNGKL